MNPFQIPFLQPQLASGDLNSCPPPEAKIAPWCNMSTPQNASSNNKIKSHQEHYHLPVLLQETIAILQPAPEKKFLDGTLGGGGHTKALLEAGATVCASDQDPAAIQFATNRLKTFQDRLTIRHGQFSQMEEIYADQAPFDGILLDIGVSSAQLDQATRGFSFRLNGPLDMRMDPSQPTTAADLIAELDEQELSRILFQLGEERHAKRIARNIIRHKKKEPITTTAQLAEIIASAVPGRPSPTHPATRSFQALRIAVNQELDQLHQALDKAYSLLKPNGRLAIITFHSLEDRPVKHFFARTSKAEIDQPNWPAPRPNPELKYELLTRKAITASPEEQAQNPRARSAKLRAVQKLSLH